ncbi:uncharacterized protein METZ01_LOCUS186983 [marine metagenome]|uniref:Uncharacterized protein n=1 Tax=marine metagenome TaxID=408172 RepID=A0A382D7L3_9ZZZZ
MNTIRKERSFAKDLIGFSTIEYKQP